MPDSPDTLSPRDQEWLAIYLEVGEDLRALSARLAGPSLIELAFWLRTPAVRTALAAWDSAERRARAARDEADRQLALEALRTVIRARPAPAASPDGSSHIIEIRRAATTMLRALAPTPRRPTPNASAASTRSPSARSNRPTSLSRPRSPPPPPGKPPDQAPASPTPASPTSGRSPRVLLRPLARSPAPACQQPPRGPITWVGRHAAPTPVSRARVARASPSAAMPVKGHATPRAASKPAARATKPGRADTG